MAGKKAKKTVKKGRATPTAGATKKAKRSTKKSPKKNKADGKKALRSPGTGPLIRAIRPVKTKGPEPLRLLWIPGLGADRTMFARIIEELESRMSLPALHTFLEYPDVMAEEVDSLESLATLIAQGILPDDPYDMAIGYSMGGMILQILRMKGMVQANRCALLCTGFSGNDLHTLVHAAASLPRPPVFMRGLLQKTTAALYPVFRLGVPDAMQYGRMFARFPKTIFFEGPRWIQEWKGVPEPFYADCLSVHGTRDPLLSYQKISQQRKPDLVVEGGSHILFATHPDKIAGFLANRLQA